MSIHKLQITVLSLLAAVIWMAVFSFSDNELKIITCDVGQGDASLVVYKSTEILIDGGPGDKVTGCLGKYMPFWDRSIELVMLTHPQEDHYSGLIKVFKNYRVDTFVANSLESGNQSYQVLKNEVGGGGVRVVNPLSGMKIGLGLIYLDIYWPDEAFLASNTNTVANTSLGGRTTKLDPNKFSVVASLHYKSFEALFTGDADKDLSDIVAMHYKGQENKNIKYIKVPHHGSRNGISEELIKNFNPDIAVISVGKRNPYGHPDKSVIDLLFAQGTKVYRTDEAGDIVIRSDGERIY